MSWADVAKQNRLPESEQPKPDPGLLEHASDDSDLSQSGASDDKVHVVTRDEFEYESHPPGEQDEEDYNRDALRFTAKDAAPSQQEVAKKAQADAKKVEAKAKEAKDTTAAKAKEAKDTTAAKAKEAKDTTAAKAQEAKDATAAKAQEAKDTAAATAKETQQKAKETKDEVAAEAKKDYAAAKQEVKKGAAEAEKQIDKAASAAKEEYDVLSEKAQSAYNKMSKEARDDWHKLSKESKKRWEEAKDSEVGKELQKPEVWGSILGVTNLAVLGGVAYLAITNWDRPRWGRRVISATVIGLGTWFGLQGWLIPQTDAVKQRRN